MQEIIDSIKGTDDSVVEPTMEEATIEAATTEESETEETATEELKTEGPATEALKTEEATTEETTTETLKTEESTTEESTTATSKYYVVTFKYGDKILATQKVKEKKAATRPKMKPAQTGNWDYDFVTAVTDDLIVNWVQ